MDASTPPTIRARVQSAMGELTRAERRVGHALLSEYPIAGLETAGQLAERAGVSSPTVVRFASRIGFSGHAGLQAALFSEVRERLGPSESRDGDGEPVEDGDLVGAVRRALLENVERTFDALAPAELEAATALLADPRRRVLCAGGRASGELAQLLADRALLARPGVTWLPGGTAAPELLDADRRTVLVAFDLRPHEPATLALARWARERRATVVLITDPWLSPIVELADHVLTARVDSPSPFASHVGALALVELLLAALAEQHRPETDARIDELERWAGHEQG